MIWLLLVMPVAYALVGWAAMKEPPDDGGDMKPTLMRVGKLSMIWPPPGTVLRDGKIIQKLT